MSDYNSSLPVRTEANGDVAVKVVDGTLPSQALNVDAAGKVTVKLDDGAGTALTSTLVSTKQALDVNVVQTAQNGVADKSTFTYGTTNETPIGGVFQDTSPTLTAGTTGAIRSTANRGLHVNLRDASGNEKLGSSVSAASIPVVIASDQGAVAVTERSAGPVTPGTVATNSDLIGGQFNTALPTLTTGQQAAVQLDSSGRIITAPLTSASTVTVVQPTGTNLHVVVDSGAITASGTVTANQGTANTAANGWPVKPTDGTNSQSFTAAGSAKTDIEQIGGATPSASNSLPVQITTGAAFISATNPLPVYLQDGGTSINNYNTAAAVASGATSNHDYTVTAAKTLHLGKIWASASGKLKIETQIETGVASGVFNTIYVGFNSTANPNISIDLSAYPQIAAGVRVRTIRTNDDKAAMDVYSTVSGHEQ